MSKWFIVLLIGTLSPAEFVGAQSGAQPGQDAPDLSFNEFRSRRMFDATDYRGKWLVVHFFLSQGNLSMPAMDDLIDVRTRYAKDNFMIMGVSCDVNQSDVVAMLKQFNVDWPFTHDPQGIHGRSAKKWGVTDTPEVFLVDPAGTIVWRGEPLDLMAAMAKFAGDPGNLKAAGDPPAEVPDKAPNGGEPANAGDNADAGPSPIANLVDQVQRNLDDGDLAQASIALRAAATQAQSALDKQTVDALQNRLKREVDTKAQELRNLFKDDPITATQQAEQLKATFTGTLAGEAINDLLTEFKESPELQKANANKAAEASADRVLAQAEADIASGRREQGLRRMELLATTYSHTSAGKVAASRLEALKAGPAPTPEPLDPAEAERRASNSFSMAEGFRRNGQLDLARKKYREVAELYPETESGKKALDWVRKLGN